MKRYIKQRIKHKVKLYLTRVSVRQMKKQHSETKRSMKRRKKENRNIDFAAEQLLLPQFKLHPAQHLYNARRYGLLNWISSPIRELLASSFEKYAQDSENQLGFNLYVIIATAKESIATERKRLGNHPPFPQNFDDGPFCIGAQHET